jgi:Lamin Tail Domain
MREGHRGDTPPMKTNTRALFRPVAIAAVLALLVTTGAATVAPAPVAAAGCVRVIGGNWNPAGNENYPPALNYESTKIKNYCSTAKYLTGWKLHDYRSNHVFRFPSGFRIGAGVTVTIYSGRGTRTSTKLYFGYSYGAVWNNTAPERAYLDNAAGTLVSSWSKY